MAYCGPGWLPKFRAPLHGSDTKQPEATLSPSLFLTEGEESGTLTSMTRKRYTMPALHRFTHHFGCSAMQSAQDCTSSGSHSATSHCLTLNKNLGQPQEPQDTPTEDGQEDMDSLPPSEVVPAPFPANRGKRIESYQANLLSKEPLAKNITELPLLLLFRVLNTLLIWPPFRSLITLYQKAYSSQCCSHYRKIYIGICSFLFPRWIAWRRELTC